MSRVQQINSSSAIKQLSKELYQIWETSHVPSEYREIVMTYIKKLSSKQREKYLRYQIQWNQSQKSHYFQIFRINMRRKIVLFKIRTILNTLKPQFTQKMAQICQLLSSLREMNVQISQKIIDMVKFYGIDIQQANQRILLYIWNLISNINSENFFIIGSELKLHIKFSKNYDPYFIYYYQRQKKFKMNNMEESNKLGTLYNLGINQIYKIINLRIEVLSMKRKIQTILKDLGYDYQKEDVETYLYRMRQEQKGFNQEKSIYNHEISQQTSPKNTKDLRAISYDALFNKQLKSLTERRADSSHKQLNNYSRLGKIMKNGSISLYSSRQIGSVDIIHHNKSNIKVYQQSLSQSRSQRRQKRSLKIVKLQPLNIHVKKQDTQSEYQEKHNHTETQNRPLWHRQLINKSQSQRNNQTPIRYDCNPKRKSNRFPGFIKNMKKNISSHRKKDYGLIEENPIISRNTKQSSSDKIQQRLVTSQEKQECKSKKLIKQQIQTQFQAQQSKQQIQMQQNYQNLQSSEQVNQKLEERQAQIQSQRQQCNNPDQHLQAVSFIKKLNKGDDLNSLMTLDEQNFIDVKLTPLKNFKIPMSKTITQEQLSAFDHQKEQIAQVSRKKAKRIYSKKVQDNLSIQQSQLAQKQIDQPPLDDIFPVDNQIDYSVQIEKKDLLN